MKNGEVLLILENLSRGPLRFSSFMQSCMRSIDYKFVYIVRMCIISPRSRSNEGRRHPSSDMHD